MWSRWGLKLTSSCSTSTELRLIPLHAFYTKWVHAVRPPLAEVRTGLHTLRKIPQSLCGVRIDEQAGTARHGHCPADM